jgi:hypothetical protein
MAQGRVSWSHICVLVCIKYVPKFPGDNNICKDSGIQCNDEIGVIVDRGPFTLSSGQCAIYILSSFYGSY